MYKLTALQPLTDRNGEREPISASKTIIQQNDGTYKALAPVYGNDAHHPTFYVGFEQPFTTSADLFALLEFAAEAGVGVVHSEIIPGTTNPMRRRANDSVDANGKTEKATLRDRLCPYIMIDIDSLPLPDGYSLLDDPERCVRFALACLPEALAEANIWYQFSASAGLSGNILKIHLVAMLAEPWSRAEMKAWAAFINWQFDSTGKTKLVDPAPYASAASIVYVAPPKVADGAIDPIPAGKRSGVLLGRHEVAHLERAPADWFPAKGTEPSPTKPRSREGQGGDRALSGRGAKSLPYYLSRLGAEVHDSIFRGCAAAVRSSFHPVNIADVEAKFRKAASSADFGTRSAAYVEQELARIPSHIQEAEAKKASQKKAAPFGVAAPIYASPDEAKTALGAALDGFATACQRFRGRQEGTESETSRALADIARTKLLYSAQLKDGTLTPARRKALQGDLKALGAQRKALRRDMAAMAHAPLLAVKATTGTGKTTEVIARLLKGQWDSVYFLCPTHATLTEIAAKLEAEARNVKGAPIPIHIFGRTHQGADGKFTMCQHGDLAGTILSVGGDASILCGDDAHPCQHRKNCPFLDQRQRLDSLRDGTARLIYLMATETLPNPRPGGLRPADLVVIDETFWRTLIDTSTATFMPDEKKLYPLRLADAKHWGWKVYSNTKDEERTVIAQTADEEASAKLDTLWSKLAGSLESADCDSAGYFKISGFGMALDEVKTIVSLLKRCKVYPHLHIRPGLSEKAIRAKCAELTTEAYFIRLARYLAEALILDLSKSEAQYSGLVAVRGGVASYVRKKLPKLLGSKAMHAIPTLFLDAELNPEIVRAWWKLKPEQFVNITVEWSESVRVVQIAEPSFSKKWALGCKEAPRHQAQLIDFVRFVQGLYGATDHETFFCGNRGLLDALGKKDKAFATNSPMTSNFNGLAGRDSWKDVRLGFVVGRTQPADQEFSTIARAVWGDEDRDWTPVTGNLPKERRRIHLRSGEVEALYTSVMVDAREEAMLEQVSWGEAHQADGRIRPVYRTPANPCTLFVLGDVPRGCKVDAVLTWEDAKPNKFLIAAARAITAGKVIPASDGALAEQYPDLWKSRKEVCDARRTGEGGSGGVRPLADVLAEAVFTVGLLVDIPALSYKNLIGECGYIAKTTHGEARLKGRPGRPIQWLAHTSPDQVLGHLRATWGSALIAYKTGDGEWNHVSFEDTAQEGQYEISELAA